MHVFTFTCCVASFLPVLKYHKVNWDFFPQLETFVLSYIHNSWCIVWRCSSVDASQTCCFDHF